MSKDASHDREEPHEQHRPMAGDMPNELAVAAAFPTADDRPLREQTSLTDADGADIRQYTGEPVETEFGVVVPQQMAVGSERVVGGGEFPNTPGREPRRDPAP
jgi:hypothetical protein